MLLRFQIKCFRNKFLFNFQLYPVISSTAAKSSMRLICCQSYRCDLVIVDLIVILNVNFIVILNVNFIVILNVNLIVILNVIVNAIVILIVIKIAIEKFRNHFKPFKLGEIRKHCLAVHFMSYLFI